MKYRFVDLCAGIGGFHQAFKKLGMECVYASEIDEAARKSYMHNFAFPEERFNRDIYDLDTSHIEDFDICCAGFPCQPFSLIGKKKGFDEMLEQRGNIFYEIERIIKDKRPKAFVLENVRNILKHDKEQTFKIIMERLEHLGYSFFHQVLKAQDFGLPQSRPRVFMVGFDKRKFNDIYFPFPTPIPLKKSMSDIFGGECNKKIGYTLRVGGARSGRDNKHNWDTYIVDNKEFKLRPEHGLAMQGFPEDFYLADTESKSMKLLGNSVAVDVVYHLGKMLVDVLDNPEKHPPSPGQHDLWSMLR